MLRLEFTKEESEELQRLSEFYDNLHNEMFDKITSAAVARLNTREEAHEETDNPVELEKIISDMVGKFRELMPYEQKKTDEYRLAIVRIYQKAEERSREFYTEHPDELLKALKKETHDELVKASIEAIQKKEEVDVEQVKEKLLLSVERYLPPFERINSDGLNRILAVIENGLLQKERIYELEKRKILQERREPASKGLNSILDDEGIGYLTRGRAGEIVTMLPSIIATPTLPGWENGVSLHQQGHAYLQPTMPLDVDSLNFHNGKLYFEGKAFSEATLESIKTKEGIEKIDLPLLRFYYSIILEQFYDKLRKGGKLEEVLTTSSTIKLYLPDLVKRLGEYGHFDKDKTDEMLKKTLSFHNIIGIIHGPNGNHPSYFPVLIFTGFEGGTNTISFESPYLSYLVKEIYGASIRRNKRGQPQLKKNGTPALMANHSYLIKASIASERNKAAIDNVSIIVTTIEQAGDNAPHISAQTIIERNPAFEQRLLRDKRPN